MRCRLFLVVILLPLSLLREAEGEIWHEAYLKSGNPTGYDNFGWSVAISSDLCVVGVPWEPNSAAGVNAPFLGVKAASVGAAYIYARDPGGWRLEAYLKASNAGTGDTFGQSVAISENIVVVGAPWESSEAVGVNGDQENNDASRSGAAYIFVKEDGKWRQEAYLKGPIRDTHSWFGICVSVSGSTVVIGAPHAGGGATGVNGNPNAHGNNQGSAFVFTRSAGVWRQSAYLKSSTAQENGSFGTSVAIDGSVIIVGAQSESSASTGVNGSEVNFDTGAIASGAAYIFEGTGGSWRQTAYLKASNTEQGDGFGNSVAVSGYTVVVGATGEDADTQGVNGDGSDNDTRESGAAYIFSKPNGAWRFDAYLKASNPEVDDRFGTSVAIEGDTVLVGAPLEDGRSRGINGDGSDNGSFNSGAIYAFAREGSVWEHQAYIKPFYYQRTAQFGKFVAISNGRVLVGADNDGGPGFGVNDYLAKQPYRTFTLGAAHLLNLRGERPERSFSITHLSRSSGELNLLFSGEPGVDSWELEAVSDASAVFMPISEDLNVFEVVPGTYKATIEFPDGMPASYLVKVRR